MTTRDRFRGTGVDLVTAFGKDGTLDLDAYADHAERVIAGGVEMLVPCGTTGESVTMTHRERIDLIQVAVQIADQRVAVVAGIGANDTREAQALARAARDAGADAVMPVTPWFGKPPQEGLFRHFDAVSRAAEITVFLYNVPGRSAVNLHPDTTLRLAEIPNVAGVVEASGDLGQVTSILARRPDDFLVLSGDDELALPMLALGADGLVSVVANQAPRDTADMVRLGLDGDFARARWLHFRLLDLIRANATEINPIPVKKGVELLGGATARYREPLLPPTPSTEARLLQALGRAGLIDEGVGAGREVA
jgi:4-hydroxy-tetrahydrodipicolinate synthase